MNRIENNGDQLLSAELTKLDEDRVGEKALFTSQHQRRIVNQVEVQLEAYLGQGSMTIEQLFALKQGEVIALDTQLSEPVELRLNTQLIARGELCVVGEHFAVRITELAD